jgi:Bacterial RNA polymerase, alpha chain C terminal domain
MGGRARVASLPDETPVEDLPLRQRTSSALRAAGVLSLGELRVMLDHELLRLRPFGRGALAEVRALVPAPAARTGGEAVIAGRVFTLGAVYAPPGTGSGRHKPRRLLGFSQDSPLPGGRVTVELVPSGRQEIMAGAVWAAWAGEEVDPDEAGGGGRP